MAEAEQSDIYRYLDGLHPGASLLSKVQLIAEFRNLDDLLGAYKSFCLASYNCLSWENVASLLTHTTRSHYLKRISGEPRLFLTSRHPYRIFLSKLNHEYLGYHISDIVIAFFHHTGVLQTQHHIERSRGSEELEVTDWTTKGPGDPQAIVRTHYLQLSRPFLRVLFKGIKDEILARIQKWKDLNTYPEPYIPCSRSILETLLHLDIQIDPDLSETVEKIVGRQRDPPSERWNFSPFPLQLAQPGSLLGRLRSPRQTPTSLGPIQELQATSTTSAHDDGQSILSLATSDDSDRWTISSKRSTFSDYQSFVTAFTQGSGFPIRSAVRNSQSQRSAVISARTNQSSIQTFFSWPANAPDGANVRDNDWSIKLRLLRNIVSDPELEAWSGGRGQHAQFSPEERNAIPLVSEHEIGKGSTAVVDAVICRQVRLVRKVIMLKYNKRLKEAREGEAMSEVQQLYRAQHAHIVRLVGTYVIEHELAILTYPRAEWNLEQFLTRPPTDFIEEERRDALRRFFGCLAKVLDFIHSCPIKHMDIKPQNILVRDMRTSSIDKSHAFQVYLTDFGSSKFYPSVEDTVTDSLTPYTRIYAAKEVLLDDFRGLPADVFSMGCVFAEMLASGIDFVQDSGPRDALLDACGEMEGNRKPFCTRVKQVRQWLRDLIIDESHVTFLAAHQWISLMLSDDPQARPSARELVNDARLMQSCSSCDRATPEAFERIVQGSDG